MNATVAWFTAIAFLAYIVSVDENVLQWLYLFSQRVTIWGRKLQYHVWHSPLSPIRKVLIQVNAHSTAKQLLKEFSQKEQNDGPDRSN